MVKSTLRTYDFAIALSNSTDLMNRQVKQELFHYCKASDYACMNTVLHFHAFLLHIYTSPTMTNFEGNGEVILCWKLPLLISFAALRRVRLISMLVQYKQLLQQNGAADAGWELTTMNYNTYAKNDVTAELNQFIILQDHYVVPDQLQHQIMLTLRQQNL